METATATALRILILDDNVRVRDALARRLTDDPGVEKAAAVDMSTVTSVPSIIAEHDPHVVLIDPRGGDRSRDVLDEVMRERSRTERFVVAVHVSYRDELEESSLGGGTPALYVLKGMKTGDLLARLMIAARNQLHSSRWNAG